MIKDMRSRLAAVEEVVKLPNDLVAFAKDPKFQQITFKIRQQTSIDSILFDSSLQAVVIKAPDVDSASIARKLVETNLRNQMRLQSIEIKLQETQNELFNKQGEIASGMTMEVHVKKELVGFVIGKSGAHVNEIKAKYNVNINIIDPPAGQDKAKIIIYGSDQESVKKARESVELFDEEFSLTPAQAQYLSDYRNNVKEDFKKTSELLKVDVNTNKNTLHVVGTHTAVRMARYQLEAVKEFINSATNLYAEVQTAQNQLFDFKKQYNMHGGGRGRGERDIGGRGYGGRDSGRGSGGRGSGGRDSGRGSGGRGSGDARIATDSLASLPPAQSKKVDKAPVPPPAPVQSKNKGSSDAAAPKNDTKKSKNVEEVSSQLAKATISDAAPKDSKQGKKKPAPKNEAAAAAAPSTTATTVPTGGAPAVPKESKKKVTDKAAGAASAPVNNPPNTASSAASTAVATAADGTGAVTDKPKRNRKRNGGKKDEGASAAPTAVTPATTQSTSVPPPASTATNASKDIVVPPSNLEKRVKKERGNKSNNPSEPVTTAPTPTSAAPTPTTTNAAASSVAGGKEKQVKDTKKMTIRDAKESKKEKEASKSDAPSA